MQRTEKANKPSKQVTKLINMLEIRKIFSIEKLKMASILMNVHDI